LLTLAQYHITVVVRENDEEYKIIMARYTGPQKKRDRRFGLLQETIVEAPRSKTRRRPRRKSEYGIRLEEKQKVRHIYGVLERQFKRYFARAHKNPSNTGLVLMEQLEKRLDNVIYRLGFAPTRRGARQIVNHGHVTINGGRVDIPSYSVSPGEKIELKEHILAIPMVTESLENKEETQVPSWLRRSGNIGTVVRELTEDDIRDDVDIRLIIEYYSK